MTEKIYELSKGNEKTVKMVIHDENLHYNQMILNKGEGIPEHFTNSNVYMTVLRGKLSIILGGQEVHQYNAGNILKIPNNTKMKLDNLNDETLEFIVIKSPAPKI